MSKVLFIASHRFNRAPAQRFRFEQYFGFLQENGVQCELSSLISEKQDYFIYKPGYLLQKFWLFSIQSKLIRLNNLLNINSFDTIFVNREALLTGSVFFEQQFAKSKARLIFDFDDAIWRPNVSDANKRYAWLKNPAKTSRIIKMADQVVAGNQYLAEYASAFNKNILIIPTTINTSEYFPRTDTPESKPVCIGWSGSITTIQHFNSIKHVLHRIKEKYREKVCFKLIGDDTYHDPILNLNGIAWNSAPEIQELSEFDIGIMPLPDDEWSKGKCGLKGLQYMALKIPAVMSPVGVNNEIIQDGTNGFLPENDQDWFEKLSLLIEHPGLRLNLGNVARKTVEDYYSFNAWKNTYLDLLR